MYECGGPRIAVVKSKELHVNISHLPVKGHNQKLRKFALLVDLFLFFPCFLLSVSRVFQFGRRFSTPVAAAVDGNLSKVIEKSV